MIDCVLAYLAGQLFTAQQVHMQVRYDLAAFRDANPQAPVHIQIIPRKHIPSLTELPNSDLPVVSRMVALARRLADEEGVSEKGYRLVINNGPEGGQVIPHLHMHLLGGKKLAGKVG